MCLRMVELNHHSNTLLIACYHTLILITVHRDTKLQDIRNQWFMLHLVLIRTLDHQYLR